jgi:hypothetical protein
MFSPGLWIRQTFSPGLLQVIDTLLFRQYLSAIKTAFAVHKKSVEKWVCVELARLSPVQFRATL